MARAARGFTLIELVVTLTLVSVLALVAVPLYEVTVTRAKEAELRTSLRQIRNALDAYKAASDNGQIARAAGESGYPPDLATLVTGVDVVAKAAGSTFAAAPIAPPPGFPPAGPNSGAGNAPVPGPTHLVFLREVPRDPFYPDPSTPTDQQWNLRAYAAAADDFSGGSDVFDIKSKSTAVGMNGIPYKDW